MEQELVPYYHAQHNQTPDQLYNLLASRTFSFVSTTVWHEMRVSSSQPIYRNQLGSLRSSLISHSHSHELKIEKGAYVDFGECFNNIITTYTEYQAFNPAPQQDKSLLWKLSWDNRYIWGKNQAWTLSPLSVLHNQQSQHVHDIMIAKIPEHNLPFTRCVLESQMLDFFGDFSAQTLTYKGEEVYQDLILCTDWISMCCELDLTLPNTPNLHKVVCFKCAATKELLRTRWLDDPFQWHDNTLTITDFPNAAFDNISLDLRRYCWMHGCSNLLSNLLILCHNLLPARSPARTAFHTLIHRVCAHWHPTKALIPKQMKEFFQYQLHSSIPSIFDTQHLHHLHWPCTPHTFVRSTSAIVAMALDSVQVYKDFAYTPKPTPEDFHSIHVARDCILSIHSHFKWRLAPTTHYLTNHAILEAEEDGTAYNTLQEGVEHKNQEDLHEAHVTMKGTYIYATHESSWEHMLNQQTLRSTLTYWLCSFFPHTYNCNPTQQCNTTYQGYTT